MSVQTVCPNCDTSHTLADDKTGKRIKCKKCQEPFVVAAGNAKTNGKVNGKLNGAVNGKAHSEVVEIACPECDATMKVRSETLGKKVRCKKCEAVYVAKVAGEEDDEEDEDLKTKVTAKPDLKIKKKKDDEDDKKDKKPKKDKKGAKDEDGDEDDDEDGKGKKKKKKKKDKSAGPPVALIAAGGGGVLVLIAIVVVVVIMMSGGDPPPAPPPPANKDQLAKKDNPKKDKDAKDKEKDGKKDQVDPGDPGDQGGDVLILKNDPLPQKMEELQIDGVRLPIAILAAVSWFKNPLNSPFEGQCVQAFLASGTPESERLAKAKPWLVGGKSMDFIDVETKQKKNGPAVFVEHHKRREVAKELEKLIDSEQFKTSDDCWETWTKWVSADDLVQMAIHLTRAPKDTYRMQIMASLARINTEDAAKIQAKCLEGTEHTLAAKYLKEMGGEVCVDAVFNYVYYKDQYIRDTAYTLLQGYAIHWDGPDVFAKKGGSERPWLELHLLPEGKALMIKKDAVTTLSKKGSNTQRVEGNLEYQGPKDKDGKAQKETITIKFNNSDVLTGTFNAKAELACKLEGPSAKAQNKDSVSFNLERKGIPSIKPSGEYITWVPKQPLPPNKLPADKTNWLLYKKPDSPTVIDVPRLPKGNPEVNGGSVLSALKGEDRLQKLAGIGWLQRTNIDGKLWEEVASSLDPNVGNVKDQFLRTNSLLALDRWSKEPNIGSMLSGIQNKLAELKVVRKEFGQTVSVPSDHDLMIQGFVKIPDKEAAGKALAAVYPELYLDYRKKFDSYLTTTNSLEVGRTMLKYFNHKEPDILDVSRRTVLKLQKAYGKDALTDDEITEQCVTDMGDKEKGVSALSWMKDPTFPTHSDAKRRIEIGKSLEGILQGDDKEGAAIRALAGDVYVRYTGAKFVKKAN